MDQTRTVSRKVPAQTVAELSRQVRNIAYGMARRLPSHISVDELISAGNEGLAWALQRYQESDEASFGAYARCRIRGAIQDALRRHDTLTRTQRNKLKRIREAEQRLADPVACAPEPDEIARAAALSLESYWKAIEHAQSRASTSLDEADFDDAAAHREPWSAEEEMLDLHDCLVMRRALDRLPERLGTVMRLHYLEAMTLRQVGEILGVTESRAHQLREQALTLLRSWYSPPSLWPRAA